VVEAGVPGSEFNFWIGMLAPANTPRPIIDQLHAAAVKALDSEAVKSRFLDLGAQAWTLEPEAFDQYIEKEIGTNADIVKAAGISAQ